MLLTLFYKTAPRCTLKETFIHIALSDWFYELNSFPDQIIGVHSDTVVPVSTAASSFFAHLYNLHCKEKSTRAFSVPNYLS